MATQNAIVWGVGTPRTLRVHWALHELGWDYETRAVFPRTSAMDDPAFLRVSPGKKIPALQHGSITLTESGAITRYLMDNFSGHTWSPSERATIDRLTFFTLMEIDATALYVIRRHEGLPDVYGEAPTAVAAAYAYADRQLAVLTELLGDRTYGAGERFSEADIHIGSVLDWAHALGIELPAALARYHAHVRSRPAYQAAFVVNAAKT